MVGVNTSKRKCPLGWDMKDNRWSLEGVVEYQAGVGVWENSEDKKWQRCTVRTCKSRDTWWVRRGMLGPGNRIGRVLDVMLFKGQWEASEKFETVEWHDHTCALDRFPWVLLSSVEGRNWRHEAGVQVIWALSYIAGGWGEVDTFKDRKKEKPKRFTWLAMTGGKRKDKDHTLVSDLSKW